MHILHILLSLFNRAGYRAIDAFGGNQDTSFESKIFAVLQMLVFERFRVRDLNKFIIEKDLIVLLL